MATKTNITYTDDITGQPFEPGVDGDTFNFSLDGKDYEIDLHYDNKADMALELGRWVDHARKAGPVRRTARRSVETRRQSQRVRAWAVEQGLLSPDVSFGRIPDHINERYKEAHR